MQYTDNSCLFAVMSTAEFRERKEEFAYKRRCCTVLVLFDTVRQSCLKSVFSVQFGFHKRMNRKSTAFIWILFDRQESVFVEDEGK